MARAKYLPVEISSVIKETGAHPMCILSKIVGRKLKWPVDAATLRSIADECTREEKYVPVVKLLRAIGAR